MDRYRCLQCGAGFDLHCSWCSSCLCQGSVILVGRRARAIVDYEPEVTSARELMRTAWDRVELPAYPSFACGRAALVVVTGEAGSGKSTWTCRAIDGLPGPVVLASVEEPPGPSLAARLARAAVKRESFVVTGRATIDQLVEVCRDRQAMALAIDSVQPAEFSPRDLRHLLLVLPKLAVVVAVAQVNKLGRIAGANTLEHEADVVVECREMRWQLIKSRYQPIDDDEATGAVLRGERSEERAAREGASDDAG